MSKNSNLGQAKAAKNDEFYTQYADIQKEVNAYLEYDADCFRGKTVLLPCDDPEWSNFTKFFINNFTLLGLKKLVSTSYAAEAKPNRGELYQPSLFEQESPQFDRTKTASHGKIFVLDGDANGNGVIDTGDIHWEYLEGDGDFRSDEVRKLRDEADIIVTNPPFSLFREFMAWILKDGNSIGHGEREEHGENASRGGAESAEKVGSRVPCARPAKKFLIIGNMNAVTYKEIFPLIKGNDIWIGNGFAHGDAYFEIMETKRDFANGVYDAKTGLVKFRNCCWFTNMDHGRRHEPLSLMTERDNIKYSKHKEVRSVGYIHYSNYDAIEIPYTDAIPSDFAGVMGVPKSFLDKYCPEQFEIVGCAEGDSGRELGLKPFPRELKKLNPSIRDGQLYYMQDGVPVKPYARILIRHLHPEATTEKGTEK